EELLRVVADQNETNGCLMSCVHVLGALGTQLLGLKKQILELDRMIMVWYRSSRRLHYIPGVGPLLATALVANIADPQGLSDQAVISPPGLAWCRSSIQAGARTGSAVSANKVIVIYAACVAGALSVIRYAKAHGSKHRPWLTALLARRPAKVAAIALANKLARMAWAMMAKGERYRNTVALAA